MIFPAHIDHNGFLTTEMIYSSDFGPHGQDDIQKTLLTLLRRKSPNDFQIIEIISGDRGDDIEDLVKPHSEKTGTDIVWEEINDNIEIKQLPGTEIITIVSSEVVGNLDTTLSDIKPFSALSEGIDYLQSKLNRYHPESPFTREDTILCIFNQMMPILLKLVPETQAENQAISTILSQATFAHDKSINARENLLFELSEKLSNFYDVLGVTIQEFFKLYVRENLFDIEDQEDYNEPLAGESFVSFNISLPIWYIIYLYYADFLTHQEGVKLGIGEKPIDYFRHATKQELRNVLRSKPEDEYINHDVFMLDLSSGGVYNIGG